MTTLSQHAGGGTEQRLPWLEMNGTDAYFTKSSISVSGNVVTFVCKFKINAYTGDKADWILYYGIGGDRLKIATFSTDYTAEAYKASTIQVWNTVGIIQTYVGFLDGNEHTLFIEANATAGTMIVEIDGQDAIDTGNAGYVAPSTGVFAGGSTGEFRFATQATAGLALTNGQFNFVGLHDTSGLTATDFFPVDGSEPTIDETSWTEWGSQPVVWNAAGNLFNNLGTTGTLTAGGSPKMVGPLYRPSLGLDTTGDATAADIASGKIAWVDGVRVVGTVPKLLVHESFNSADNTAISGHIPEFGNAWGDYCVLSTENLDTGDKITGRKLIFGTDNHGAAVETNQANVIIRTIWTPSSTANSRNSICLRVTGAGEMLALNIRKDNGDWQLLHFTGGGLTVNVLDSGAYTWTANQQYSVAVVAQGTSIKGYINGVLVGSATTSENLTSTKHGLARNGGNSDSTFDEFWVWGIDETASIQDLAGYL